MKTRFLPYFILLFLLFTAALYAQDFQLIYNEGEISVKQGSSWVDIYPGDLLPENSVVRLDRGEIAEFASAGASVLFSKPGTYQLKSAVKQKEAQQVGGLSSVFNRVAKIGRSGEQGQSQAMGVRGAEAGDNFELTWVEEDTQSFEKAKSAYDRQDYSAAVDIFENEVDPMLLSDESAYWYYLASSYLNMDKKGPALQIALSHEADEYSRVYPEFVLLKGRLYMESSDFSEAAVQFKEYIDRVSSPAQLQLGHFLYGFSQQQNGNESESRKALNEAVRINADSEITSLAEQFL